MSAQGALGLRTRVLILGAGTMLVLGAGYLGWSLMRPAGVPADPPAAFAVADAVAVAVADAVADADAIEGVAEISPCKRAGVGYFNVVEGIYNGRWTARQKLTAEWLWPYDVGFFWPH